MKLVLLLLLLVVPLYGTKRHKYDHLTIIGSDTFYANVSAALLIIGITPYYRGMNWYEYVADYGLRYIIEFNDSNLYALFNNVEPYPDWRTQGMFVPTRPDRIYIRSDAYDFSATIVHEATHLYLYRTKILTDYDEEYHAVRVESIFKKCRRKIDN